MTKKQAVKYQPKVYSNKELLEKAFDHLITKKLSVWTLSHPTKQAYDKRCKEDEIFKEQFLGIQMMQEQLLETILWDNINNKDFNDKLFNIAIRNKRFNRDHFTIELEERIAEMEKRVSNE